jgi:hypothetical protein
MKIYQEDLSVETLKAIKNDLAKLAHLRMYQKLWEEILRAIEERENPDRKRRF